MIMATGILNGWTLAALAMSGIFLIVVALLDLRYRIVPNRLVYPAAVVALTGRLLLYGAPDALTALGAGMGAFGLFFLAGWVSPGGLGGGDIKLAGLIGFLTGFPGIFVALIVAVTSGGLAAGALIASGKRDPIPYAPFLCLGALVALIWNPLPALLGQALGG